VIARPSGTPVGKRNIYAVGLPHSAVSVQLLLPAGAVRVVRRVLAFCVAALIVLAVLFHTQVVTGARAALFILQVFPQVPVKPLDWITRAPAHRRVSFATPQGTVIADFFLPRPLIGEPARLSEPAIVIAQGVRLPVGARSGFVALSDTLARLGYVVLFPQLQTLATGHAGLEDPETYVRSFTYLERVPQVNPRRISYLGISVGSSVALVGASDGRINRQVHALIFFAGYYNIDDYLVSVATGRDPYHGKAVRWSPDPSAASQIKAILRANGSAGLLPVFQSHTVDAAERVLRASDPRDLLRMQRYNPASHMASYRAATFILEDRGDTFVPYVESEKLAAALPRSQRRALLITNVFHHVLPGQGGLLRLAQGSVSLFGFLYQVLAYL